MKVDEVFDPEEGSTWRWELRLQREE